MYIIGELINGMYKRIAQAIKDKDTRTIQEVALSQVSSGVDALDVNTGPLSRDPKGDICWLVETIQAVTDSALCLDSSNPAVIAAGLEVAGHETVINSTTADEDKLGELIPLAKKHNSRLIGIAINAEGIPRDHDKRLELGAAITAACVDQSFPVDRLLLDPIVLPVNVAQGQMQDILETIRDFKLLTDPAPMTVVGLSNVSQGTKQRRLINRTFLTMALIYGLDAAILDPCDDDLLNGVITAELILNKQIYCDSFLEAYRKR